MPLTHLITRQNSICPRTLLPLKAFILSTKKRFLLKIFNTTDPINKLLSNINWTTWSPPNELFHQFLEWEPLSNINYIASVLTSYYPGCGFYFLFLLILLNLILLFLTFMIYSHLVELSKKRDYELKFTMSITHDKKYVFPSPNF